MPVPALPGVCVSRLVTRALFDACLAPTLQPFVVSRVPLRFRPLSPAALFFGYCSFPPGFPGQSEWFCRRVPLALVAVRVTTRRAFCALFVCMLTHVLCQSRAVRRTPPVVPYAPFLNVLAGSAKNYLSFVSLCDRSVLAGVFFPA